MKKFLSITVCALLLIGAMSVNVSAETYTQDYIKYTVDEASGTAYVSNADMNIKNANIVSEINGYKVTSIGESAFANSTSLTTVTIPDTVTTIGKMAFGECTALSSVTFGNSVETIDTSAFSTCTSLLSVDLPDSVTTIGYGAFQDSSAIETISLPQNVTSIGEHAFYGTALFMDESSWQNDVLYIDNYLIKGKTSLVGRYTVKSGTKLIADGAFRNCRDLTGVVINKDVEILGRYVFDECEEIDALYYTGSQEEWKEISVGADNEAMDGFKINYNYNPTVVIIVAVVSIAAVIGLLVAFAVTIAVKTKKSTVPNNKKSSKQKKK